MTAILGFLLGLASAVVGVSYSVAVQVLLTQLQGIVGSGLMDTSMLSMR